MNDQLPAPVFMGRIGHGKALLPADTNAGQLASALRRALHTVECRELGPEAAQQRFGLFADTVEGRVTVFMDEDELQARHPGHEVHELARAVRERGPAVDVELVSPKPSIVLMDEMAHVVGKSAESASGTGLPGPSRRYELRRPLWPLPTEHVLLF
ncbi:hypothetical protein OG749_46035 (plasmid) [Streptomyces nojiriensis]|uniref:hypothetical protein n=1 Tax=Streptomyces nojiriensis TaxID=66374 RepID=UPI002E19D90B